MKNSTWIAVSFSMLTTLAANAQAAQSEQKIARPDGPAQHVVSNETSKLVAKLNLNQKPAFENALPCVARGT